MADTLYCDVSEWQVPVDDSYPHPVLCIRSNDGTYRDKKWAQNYDWARRATDSGRLTFFQVYYVWHENWQDGVATLKSQVGQPHPKMVVMLDVESWNGQITGNQSAGINAAFEDICAWLGDRRRVIGYGNQGDLDSLWPQRPAGIRLAVAKYSTTRPDYHGQIAHQYTDGAGHGSGPQSSPPFGNCDHNYAYGLDAHQFADALGVGGEGAPPVELVGERVLNYDHNIVPQETGYNCGPASAQVALSCRGIFEHESVLAQECGTDSGGTDYVGLIERCLDPRVPEANYSSHDAPNDPPLGHQYDVFWDVLKRSIDNGYAVVMNWVVPASNRPVAIKGSETPGYGNYTTYHYVTAAGYDDSYPGKAVWIADSGFRPYGYWIAFDQCCTLIPPKAFCYANLPHIQVEEPEEPVSDTDRYNYEQLCGPINPDTGYGTGWAQLGQNAEGQNLFVVDALAAILSGLEGPSTTEAAPALYAEAPNYEALVEDQLRGPVGADGERHGWPQLGGRSVTDAVAEVKRLVEAGGEPPFPQAAEAEAPPTDTPSSPARGRGHRRG